MATATLTRRSPLKFGRGILALLLLAIVALAGYWGWNTYFASRRSAPSYQTAEVTRGSLTVTVNATGPITNPNNLQLTFKNSGRLAELEGQFHFSKSGNAEVRFEWLQLSLQRKWLAVLPEVESFLTKVGRRKFIKPLYAELLALPDGKKRAQAIYAKARPGYHPISQSTIDALLK